MTVKSEKLQDAVKLSITAGYQLDKEAFEVLRIYATKEDPTEIISMAISEIEKMEEKPFFINKTFLEQIKEAKLKDVCDSSQKIVPLLEKNKDKTTGVVKQYRPYAKDVEADIKIIDNPASKLSSSGTIENYLNHFNERFKQIEKILRKRIDVKSATSINEALRAPIKTKLKIICMVTEKREFKKNIILTVEDLNSNTKILISQKACDDLRKKARLLLLDQVICLCVVKSRSPFLIAEDIIFPEIAHKLRNKAPIPVYAALTSDIHVGSTNFQKDAFNRFILWLNGKYGNEKMKKLAGHVKYVLIAGDVVDGVGIYPNQIKELEIADIYEQYKIAAKYIEQIPDYIEVVIIPGNHDASRKALPQNAIPYVFLEGFRDLKNVRFLGNPSFISFHNVEVLAYHGRSLDDIVSTVPGMDANRPEKAMEFLLQSRHLAPLYGGKTPLSPEEKDPLVIEKIPDIFHTGHLHVLGNSRYRGVLLLNSGGWQEQTDYMRRLGLFPTPGKLPVVNLQTLELKVIPFS